MSPPADDGIVLVPATTGWVERDGVVYVAHLPDGPPLVLTGSGVVVWQALVDGGTLTDVGERVAAATGESAAGVRPGILAFVGGLADAGVVVVTPPTAHGG